MFFNLKHIFIIVGKPATGKSSLIKALTGSASVDTEDTFVIDNFISDEREINRLLCNIYSPNTSWFKFKHHNNLCEYKNLIIITNTDKDLKIFEQRLSKGIDKNFKLHEIKISICKMYAYREES